MAADLSVQGGAVGIGCVPARGKWQVQDGPAGIWWTQANTPGGVASQGGLRGLHLDRPSTDLNPHGIMWHVDGVPRWGMGMDFDSATYPIPDLILLNGKPGSTSLDYFRCRYDTAQIDCGFGVGHPSTNAQLHVATLGPGVVNAAQFDAKVLITAGGLGLPNRVAKTALATPGTVTGAIEIFDGSGNSLGSLPVYANGSFS